MSTLPPGAAPPCDLSQLVLGFASAALYHCGHQVGSQPPAPKNQALARHNMAIVALLREKTRGNLTAEEASLVDEVSGDLERSFAEAFPEIAAGKAPVPC